MAFGLEDNAVVLDGSDFDAVREVNTGKNYFAERVAVKGILNYGYVAKNNEVRIDLAANGINAPIIIDSIVGFAQNSTADEIYFYLYRKSGRALTKIGTQRFSNGEM